MSLVLDFYIMHPVQKGRTEYLQRQCGSMKSTMSAWIYTLFVVSDVVDQTDERSEIWV